MIDFFLGKENVVAICHLSIKVISRGKGKPAVAAAAYRATKKITSEYDGKTSDYSRNWNDKTKAEEWRAAWANAVNVELRRRNVAERIDHRSYERRGIEQIPTIHMGVAATQMERKGIRTERGNNNRDIEPNNTTHCGGTVSAVPIKT
jgi:hypothetical protein